MSAQPQKSKAKKDWRQNVADEMIRQIEAGTAPWQKPWDANVIGFSPHNPTSEKPYRGINAMWLDMQGHEDPRWLTYKQASAMGVQVRGGEKSTQIEYWKWTDRRPVLTDGGVPVLDENDKMKFETFKLDRPQVFYANVFNAEQIDGMEPFKAPEPTFEPVVEAERVLVAGGVKITQDQSDRAFYRPSTDHIHLPPATAFPDAYEYYSTALHELGHATGHSSRMNRNFGPFGTEVYGKEELKVELASYIVSRDLGLGHYPERHASYAEGWVKTIKADRNVLFQAARDADQIATWIQQPELRPNLERNAQDKAKAVKMDREQSQPKNLEHLSNHNSSLEGVQAFWTDKKSRENMVSLQNEFHNLHPSKDRSLEINKELSDLFGSDKKALMFLNAQISHSPLFVRFGNDQLVNDYLDGKLTEKEALKFDLEYTQQLGEEPTQRLKRILQEQEPSKSLAENKRTYLAVPFTEKDQAKALGAKWDRKQKSWFFSGDQDSKPFEKWALDNQPKQQKAQVSPVVEFGDQLKAQGVVIKGAPLMDGKWHRASLDGDAKGTQNASYRAFLDGRPNGQIKNFRTDVTTKWVAQGESLSPEERAELQAKAAETQAKRAADLIKLHKEVRFSAMKKFDTAMFKQEHDYLSRKQVQNFGLHVSDKGNLLVPALDIDGKLWSVQTIRNDGTKLFEKNGRKTGLMHIIDPKNQINEKAGKTPSSIKGTIFIAEGYSTAATVHEAMKRPTVVAFDAGNLKPVAEAIRKQYPNSNIVIASDNDHKLENKPQGNVGLIKATEAAQAVDGIAVKPGFTDDDKEKGLSDFNDLAKAYDNSTVAKQIRQQLKHQKNLQQDPKAKEQALGR